MTTTTDAPATMPPISITEFNTILAALRFWQRCGNLAELPEYEIADDDGSALDDDAIDDLCERLNCS